MASGKYLKNENKRHSTKSNRNSKQEKKIITTIKNNETVTMPAFNKDAINSNYIDETQTSNARGNGSTRSSRIDLTNSITKNRKLAKRQIAEVDCEQVKELKIKAAERDGLITGVIMVAMMAVSYGLYTILYSFFPAISPDTLTDRLASTIINLVFGLIAGCNICG
jgi:hypothetical protein